MIRQGKFNMKMEFRKDTKEIHAQLNDQCKGISLYSVGYI
jgi:uncharacterized beta-barrel protein YwiB (DUF1934 family)